VLRGVLRGGGMDHHDTSTTETRQRSRSLSGYLLSLKSQSHSETASGCLFLDQIVQVDRQPGGFEFPRELESPAFAVVHLNIEHAVVVRWKLDVPFVEGADPFAAKLPDEEPQLENHVLTRPRFLGAASSASRYVVGRK